MYVCGFLLLFLLDFFCFMLLFVLLPVVVVVVVLVIKVLVDTIFSLWLITVLSLERHNILSLLDRLFVFLVYSVVQNVVEKCFNKILSWQHLFDWRVFLKLSKDYVKFALAFE